MTFVTDPFADPRVAASARTRPDAEPFPVERYRAIGASDDELTALGEAWDSMQRQEKAAAAEYLKDAPDTALVEGLNEWREVWARSKDQESDEDEPEPFDVAAATIPNVLAAIEAGTITREDALAAETARGEAARSSLIGKLQP